MRDTLWVQRPLAGRERPPCRRLPSLGFVVLVFHVLMFCSVVHAQVPGVFTCPNGQALSPSWVCDGFNDCNDGSDEMDCGDDIRCSEIQFACDNGLNCISAHHHCDGDFDCPDHSDERGCPMRECDSSEFQCSNRQCVHSTYQCDGDNDCGDMSDEQQCETLQECEGYECPTSNRLCIPKSWLCDGTSDCEHGHDEIQDCSTVNDCDRFGMFNCSKGGCVKGSLVCDGSTDCPHPDDDSDEDCPNHECDVETEFQCIHSSGAIECLPQTWICDGEVDCYDESGSDEVGCVGNCLETEFTCITGGECVSRTTQCDGMNDCNDGSDEYLCINIPPPEVCLPGYFPCHDGQECIDDRQLCDGGQPQCFDRSDEHPMWCDNAASNVNECSSTSHGCSSHCHDSDHAYYCTCDPGDILDDDRKTCLDINECNNRSACSQACCNTNGSYHCLCVDGYELDHDGVCKPLGERGYFLLLDKIEIRSIQFYSSGGYTVKKLVRNLHQTYAIDYHLGLDRIYWSEVSYEGELIKSAFINGSDVMVVIKQGLKDPHGLAIDWITDKIYWTDLSRKHVSVADLTGKNRTVLFSTDMLKPRGIVLDPTQGLMYWTDWGQSPRIERASMDGKDRMILHSTNIIWPNALTIDYATQFIYWIDARLDYIESSFRDGTHRMVLYRETVRHFRPFGLTLFKDELYMTDIDAREVRVFKVKENRNELVTVYTEIVEPMSVIAVHSTRQPDYRVQLLSLDGNCDIVDGYNITVQVINPCKVNNGGCEYMCLLSSTGNGEYTCACPTGHRLHSNGFNCLGLDHFLIVADITEIYIVSLDVPGPVNVPIELHGTGTVSAVTWDSRTDTIYFADKERHTISSVSITGENQRVIIGSTTLGEPVGIALDWLHNRLYWTDYVKDTIESSDLDGGRRTMVVYNRLEEPRDIVVDPERGLMFWSDWSDDRPLIMRAGLDGTYKTQLVSMDINTPNGVALDYEKQIVYWVDGNLNILEMINYDGTGRLILVEQTGRLPSGLDMYGGWLYWTTWREKNLNRINVSSPNSGDETEMIGGLLQSRDVNVFHRHRNHSVTTPCHRNNGGCSYVCVTKPKTNGLGIRAGCMCPIGYPLLQDGRTCASEVNATLLFPTGNSIHLVSQDIDQYIADSIVPVVGPSRTITTVALDPINDIIYYANTVSYGIHRLSLSDETDTVILNQHPTAITSLSIDQYSQNLYFVDSHERRIDVARTDGTRRRVLHSGLINPTGLALDTVSLRIFYIDTGDYERNENPKIYTSAMDGSGQSVIVTSNLVKPLYIAVDNNGVDGMIFWTDVYYNHIATATFDGRNQRVITVFGPSDLGSIIQGIAFFEEHIYFTDSGENVVYKSDLFGNKEIYIEDYDYLSDIKIVEPNKGSVRGCLNASRCDYLCLPNPNVPSKQTCACGTGIEPLPNGTCPDAPRTFLLVAAQASLRQIALDNPNGDYVDVPLFNASIGYEINAVDYLLTAPGEGYIYIAEMQAPTATTDWQSRIRRRNLFERDNSNSDSSSVFNDVGIIEDLAVDWTTGNVYFTRNLDTLSYIAVFDKNLENKHTLVNTGLRRPRGIALHPLEHLMFWTDFGDEPKIEIARMDGSTRRPIIGRGSTPFQDFLHPNDVLIDLNTEFVYFCEGSAGIVGVTTLAGNSGQIILDKTVDNPTLRRSQPVTSFIREPRSLSMRHLAPIHQDNDDNTEETELFWADPEFHTLSSTNLITRDGLTSEIEKYNLRTVLPRTTDYKPLAVQFVNVDGHKEGEIIGLYNRPCSFATCDDTFICVNVNSTHYQCLCPDRELNCQTITYKAPPPPPTLPTTYSTSSDTPATTQPSTTSDDSTEPTSPDDDSGGTTSPSTTGDRSEMNVGTESATQSSNEDPVKDISIGVGTIVCLFVIAFLVFVVVIFHLFRRSRKRYETTSNILLDRQPLRSLSSTNTSSSNSRRKLSYLPAKQINLSRNNSPAPTQKRLQTVLNPSQSVNEFVDEPEVYDLSPTFSKSHKQKSHQGSLFDSVDLKKAGFVEAASSEGSGDDHSTCQVTMEEVCVDEELGLKEGDELSVPPPRSCLSSISDSSQQRVKQALRVTFVEEGGSDEVVDGNTTPPPPLPPKNEGDDCENEVEVPPLPPKPVLMPTATTNDKEGPDTTTQCEGVIDNEGSGESNAVINSSEMGEKDKKELLNSNKEPCDQDKEENVTEKMQDDVKSEDVVANNNDGQGSVTSESSDGTILTLETELNEEEEGRLVSAGDDSTTPPLRHVEEGESELIPAEYECTYGRSISNSVSSSTSSGGSSTTSDEARPMLSLVDKQ